MASAGEIVTSGPRPLPRIWSTALVSFPQLVGDEWEPDQFGINRWLNGAVFAPFGCDKSVGTTFDPCVARETDYTETGECVEFHAFIAEFAVKAPTRTHDIESMQAYALAHSEVSRSARLAEQIERAAHNPTNPSLASEAQIIGNADQSLMGALIAIEDALADVLDGGAGVVHVPAAILTALASGGGIRYDADGRSWTPTGHLIVADAGTLGVSPATLAPVAGELWIYGSGPVFVKYDEAVTIIGQRGWENADIRRNKFMVDAEIYGLAIFEPCSVVAALVDIADADYVGQTVP